MRLAPLAFMILIALAAPARAEAPAAPAAASETFRFPSGEVPARMHVLDLPPAPIAVWLPADVPAAEGDRLVASLAGLLGELPPTHRAALRVVAFDPGEYPGNARKAAQLAQPALKLWASARAGAITFYRNDPPGDWRVSRRRVFHEMGHCLAHVRFGSSAPPAEWAEAARADDAFFSDYSRLAFEATGTLVEDFADAYAAYMQGRVDGGEALTRFVAAYPARARLLDAWTTGEAPPTAR
jgi:hypothetical protein